jgi:DTW domain-containing protein YfiP
VIDKKTLIPENSPLLKINKLPLYSEVEFNTQIIELPNTHIEFLPILNTTREELSKYFLEEISNDDGLKDKNISKIKIDLFSEDGQVLTTEKIFENVIKYEINEVREGDIKKYEIKEINEDVQKNEDR